MKNNQRIREHASKKGVYLWKVAERLSLTDGNFSRKLRRELSAEETQQIIEIIDDIASKEVEE